MNNIQYTKILRKNWEIVALFIGLTMVLALVISILQPFEYSATTQMLIIQKQEGNLDAYTATKSAEKIGKNLSSIVYTSSFYNQVIESAEEINAKFPQDSRERRKQWKENVKVSVIPETGILEIDVYDTDRNFAANLVKTVAYTLVDKGAEYHGGGQDVEIKIVDDVFVSKYPARPNVIVNSVLAIILGLVFGSVFVILKESRKENKQMQLVVEQVGQPKIKEKKDLKSKKSKSKIIYKNAKVKQLVPQEVVLTVAPEGSKNKSEKAVKQEIKQSPNQSTASVDSGSDPEEKLNETDLLKELFKDSRPVAIKTMHDHLAQI